jgi:flagellar basal-body rod protein FlgF
MESSITVALSRQAGLRRQLDVIANNMANMNTTGFKGQNMMFVDLLVKNQSADRPLESKVAYTRDVSTWRDYSEGPLKDTGNPLDVAVRGDGFFVVDTPDGERYTRNGNFQLNDQGQLVDNRGNAVLSEGGQPFNVAPGDQDISIARDGTVSTANGDLGRLRVVRFDNPQQLHETFGGLYTSDADPQPVDNPDVVQGMLEGSNVEAVVEMTRMIDVNRSHSAVNEFIQDEDDRIRRMVRELLTAS